MHGRDLMLFRAAMILTFLLTGFYCIGSPARAENQADEMLEIALEEKVSAEVKNEIVLLKEFLEEVGGAKFEYKREGRPDPFFPFIASQVAQAKRDEPLEELTGMRKFEPGQLSLVAIVFAKDPVAMVQDSVGKGYILKRGMKIGRYGEVEDIVRNVVVVKETRYSSSREKYFRTIKMVLNKEGEQLL